MPLPKGNYLQNLTKQAKVKECERKIDQMVYELYGLTKDEIEIIEGLNKCAIILDDRGFYIRMI